MEITNIAIRKLEPVKMREWYDIPINRDFPLTLLTVETNENIKGHSMLMFNRSGVIAEIIDFLEPIYLGEDPHDRERFWQQIYDLGQLYAGHGIGPAVSGIDIALWDIAGKNSDLPVHKLMGGNKSAIKAYASLPPQDTIEGYAELCRRLQGEGFKAFKLHAWGDVERDIELCRCIAETLPDEIELMFDASLSYNRSESLSVGQVLEKEGFIWYEDPLVNQDIEGYRHLCRDLSIPIKVGEGIGDWGRGSPLKTYHQFVIRNAADILGGVGDDIGGITSMRKLADYCEVAGINYEPHNYGPTLKQAAHFHVELAHTSCEYFEFPIPKEKFEVGMKDTFSIDSEGMVVAPQKPGLGVNIDMHEISKLTIEVI